jgi:hypothetical protein
MARRLSGYRAAGRFGLVALSLLVGPGLVRGQDAALRDRVAQLVGRLKADKAADRDAAEQALVALGAKALPALPDPASIADAEQKGRLERVREALAQADEAQAFTASKVTIKGQGMRLTEALKQLQQQSGNVVTDQREQMGEEVTNPAMDLEIVDQPFFAALDAICEKAGVQPTFYTGDGSVGILAGAPAMPGGDGPMPAGSKAPVVYEGPFRIAFRQVAASRDLATGRGTANAQFEVAWEPRLRPMLLALKSEDVSIRDDRGNAVTPSVAEEAASVILRPENPAAEVNLNMNAPDRQAQRLASLKVTAQMTLPAGVRAFRFADLTKPGRQAQGKVAVSLDSAQAEEHVWKLRVGLDYPGGGPAFESYQQGLFNNRLWLLRKDGGRLEHTGPHGGGFSNLGSDGGKLAFEYLFVDVPGKMADYGFVYETPSRVETVPVTFEFKDVALP